MMMIFPKTVKSLEVSKTVRPVTQTALVAVKSASRGRMPFTVAFGIIKNPAPINIIPKKLRMNSCAGLMTVFLKSIFKLEKSRMKQATINM